MHPYRYIYNTRTYRKIHELTRDNQIAIAVMYLLLHIERGDTKYVTCRTAFEFHDYVCKLSVCSARRFDITGTRFKNKKPTKTDCTIGSYVLEQ